MRSEHQARRVTALITLCAGGLVFVGLSHWWTEGQGLSRQTQVRLEELEKGQRQVMRVVGELDTRTTNLAASQASTERRVDELLPLSARWIPLEAGGNEQWDLAAAGRAQVQFLSMSEGGVPIFRLQNRGVEADLALPIGSAIEAVDDLGSKRRVYVTTLHRMAQDRDGKARAALISQVVREE